MSVLSTLCIFAFISAMPFIACVFYAIVVLAYRDPSAGFSYFANGVNAPKARDENTQDF